MFFVTTVTIKHTYDELGRLVQSDITVDGAATPTATTWTYDNVGNRLTQDNSTDSLAYSYNEFSQLTEIDKNSAEYLDYSYNARGAQISEIETGGATTSYTYDDAGRLAKTDDGTDTTKHFYNGKGQRIRQEVVTDTIKYYYTGSSLLFTTNDNNVKLTENILTPSGSIVVSERFAIVNTEVHSSGFYFYTGCMASSKCRRIYDQHYDVRQSTTNIIDSAFDLMQGYEYDECGNTEITTANLFINDVTFTGTVADTTGLYYMNARFYDSNTGRFLTQDIYTGNAYI